MLRIIALFFMLNQIATPAIAATEAKPSQVETGDAPSRATGKPATQLSAQKNIFLATGLSFLFPGLGHFYLGDYPTAAGLTGAGLAEVAFANIRLNQVLNNQDFIVQSFLSTPDRIRLAQSDPWVALSFNLFQNTWFYGIYAAYRDARTLNLDEGYQHAMPKENLVDLAYAPFNWRVLKKPEVWGGIGAAVVLGTLMSYLMNTVFPPQNPNQKDPYLDQLAQTNIVAREIYLGAYFTSVGIGEEAAFRGFLQPMLSEPFGKWGGLATSSVAFGAIHLPNAVGMDTNSQLGYFAFGIPWITLLGGYLGYLAMSNTSLKESVAVHMWYDFLIVTIASLLHQPSPSTRMFNFTIPF